MWTLQKSFSTWSELSTLRSPRSIMLSYWLMFASKPLLKQCRCLDILFLSGLYERQNNHFFFLILISMNSHSLLSCNLYSVMSSLIYRSILPPFAQRSSLQGLENPSSKNSAVGNDSSVFVSDNRNIPTTFHINCWDQVSSWSGPLCRNKSGPSSYSILDHIGRGATKKLVLRNCLRYLQTTLIMEGGRLVSEFMWSIVGAH